MNYDSLIDTIVAEIYKKLSGSIDYKDKAIEKVNKKKAVVLWEKDLNRYSSITSKYDLIPYGEELKECDVIIISSLCLRGLSNLAQGSSISSEERFILKSIMMGKKVYLLEDGIEYRRYKDTAPNKLYKKFIAFEKELVDFGVCIIKSLDLLLTENDENLKKVKKEVIVNERSLENEGKIIELRNKKLISESDLRKPHINGAKKIIVDKKTMITPLAADYIRIHHLKVEKV